jgi:asparagine synthase (glutamine-hydrolysing)
VKRKLLNKKAKIFDMFDYQAVEILLNQHFSGKQNRRLLIWSLLNVESWIDSNF